MVTCTAHHADSTRPLICSAASKESKRTHTLQRHSHDTKSEEQGGVPAPAGSHTASHFSLHAAMLSRSTMAHSQHSSTLPALKMRRRLRPNMPADVSTRLNSGASPVSNWHLQFRGHGRCV